MFVKENPDRKKKKEKSFTKRNTKVFNQSIFVVLHQLTCIFLWVFRKRLLEQQDFVIQCLMTMIGMAMHFFLSRFCFSYNFHFKLHLDYKSNLSKKVNFILVFNVLWFVLILMIFVYCQTGQE